MKQIFRWLICGFTAFFLIKTFKDNWLEVSQINIDAPGWAILTIATGVTLLAHIWAGWIWTWVLKELNQSVSSADFIQVYLQTNIAKYLPGNVWHYYGRIVAAKNANIATEIATFSVLLEPLLMMAAALIIIVLFGSKLAVAHPNIWLQILKLLSLGVILVAVHPWCLNPAIHLLSRFKAKKSNLTTPSQNFLKIQRYPLKPLLGELAFLGLRAMGFILTMFALSTLHWQQIPLLIGAFSFAWLLGLVVPGAPGGLGVFEATAIAILQHKFPIALVIGAIALYRLISIVAETLGAVLAWLDRKLSG
ncbi:hypothetical protein B6N60_01855 [Richelia sinica FACHB-800]|uniref:Transmembrane protein HieC n=1 Tax=Richelia sinica FACHB-800 TaxID=1357546 RepID=A0A975T6J9_9NOST|nr:lysylphosphatidylglycerol synthase domain-containing protein [Richelia sinica]MBD2664730.1 flippase-like domain-containing protein [Richelia sinica FACHB-800]QXE23166.1 hypothetical protein B6N60_01855 [Richelia sinica FACHB-800]